MLTGQYKTSLDEKGRILIPNRLRNAILGSQVIVTAGIDSCLWVFLPNTWQELSDKIMETSLFSQKARLLQRRIVAPAMELDLDKMGRILIPQNLQDIALVKKNCILHGLKKFIEIWDAEMYEAYLEANESDFKKLLKSWEGPSSYE